MFGGWALSSAPTPMAGMLRMSSWIALRACILTCNSRCPGFLRQTCQRKIQEMAGRKVSSQGRKRLILAPGVSLLTPVPPWRDHAVHLWWFLASRQAIHTTARHWSALSPRDLMHCQGFWPSTLCPKTYKLLTEDEVKKGQDMIGNSFSTTVFQAVLLASLASAPAAWETIQTRAAARQCGDQKHCQVAPLVLRRVQGKRRSPAYDFALVHKKVKEKSRSNAKVRKKRVYCRKKKGLDSRKFSKGKRAEATLWEKEQVSPSCM